MIASAESHATVFNALRLLGLGRDTAVRVPTDEQGRMRAGELAAALAAGDGPAIVCAQAGNVNTGAFDPLGEIVAACRAAGAWCHVDGAFGLWAAAAPGRAHLTAGAAGADSWAVDAHKWLNVPYESALAIVADPAPLNAAMALTAAYLDDGRRARAQRRRLGAGGVAPGAGVPALRRAAPARPQRARRAGRARLRAGGADRRAAGRASRASPILNDVVLNQALVRFGDDDAATDAVIARVQRDGTCWLGGTVWHGMAAMRISVSGWRRRRPTPTAARTRSRRRGARTDRVRPMLIEGARALVCGGASGLGAATARRLHAAGALVTIADVNAERRPGAGRGARRPRRRSCAATSPTRPRSTRR